MPENRGLQQLLDRVISRDLCALCGACGSLCPYMRSFGGRMVPLHPCDLAEGRCFAYCPRTEIDLNKAHRAVFGRDYQDLALGPYRRVFAARAAHEEIRNKAQSGGAVSALVSFALETGVIDGAVLTRRGEGFLPEGQVVRDRETVLACAGSSYVASPTLEAFNREPWGTNEKIGIVGTPCQVLAVANMRASSLEKKTPIDQVALVIGLFCTWALSYEPFLAFLKTRVDVSRIRKLDITPPPERLLKVVTDKETIDIPLDEVRPSVCTTCGVCLDMTAELSDLSVGTVEGLNGWNTVIVRSERGEALVEAGERAGVIELNVLPEENLKHLKEASLLKKRRALEALKQRAELEDGYLKISAELVQRILSGEGAS
jgi:coenzyme F420 hydrogenase subunit beta